MLDVFRENLSRVLATKSADMQSFSTDAGLGKTYVRDVIERGRDPQLSYMFRLARSHKLSLDQLLGLRPPQASAEESTVKVIGHVGAGMWHDLTAVDFKVVESPIPADPSFPAAAQFDLTVQGDSINRFARDGELLRCVHLDRAHLEARDGDMVIFERKRSQGQLIETTAKRFRRRAGGLIELWPDSDDERWQQPERFDPHNVKEGEEGRVIARVLYSYRPSWSIR